MKNYLLSILIVLGFINPFANAEPPKVNTNPPTIIPHIEMLYSEEEIYVAAQMLQGEAGSDTLTYEEKASVVCVACNRLCNSEFDIYGDNLISQIKYPYQFTGWHEWIVPTEYHLKIAKDILWRDSQRKQGAIVKWETDCCYFYGSNGHNIFY